MNRYPLWKYLVILVALAIGFLYTLPNFFGEAPAVQVSSGKATIKVDAAMMGRVESTVKRAGIEPTGPGEIALSAFQMAMDDNAVNRGALLASLVVHEAGFAGSAASAAEAGILHGSIVVENNPALPENIGG